MGMVATTLSFAADTSLISSTSQTEPSRVLFIIFTISSPENSIKLHPLSSCLLAFIINHMNHRSCSHHPRVGARPNTFQIKRGASQTKPSPQGRGKPCPYYIRASQADPWYSRGDRKGRPGAGPRCNLP